MNCEAFARWLDEGLDPAATGAARAHAAACPRCAAHLRAAETLDTLLGEPPAAPAGFTARVMARVRVTPQSGPARAALERLAIATALPWWVRAAREPACAFAAVLAGLLMWRGETLHALVTAAASRVVPQIAGAALAPPAWNVPAEWLQPTAAAALAIGLAPLLVMASLTLMHWAEALVARTPRGGRAHRVAI